MKKIAYIFDGTLEQCNSVRDILYNVLKQFESDEYEQIIVSYYGTLNHPLKVAKVKGFKTYWTLNFNYKSLFNSAELKSFQKIYYLFKMGIYNFMSRIPRIGYIYKRRRRLGFFDKILKKECPNIVIYFSISPEKGFSKICKKRNVPYVSMLYDTYIERPHLNSKELLMEECEIVNSAGYFVPSFFMDGYTKHYVYSNIHPYHLPLLISKDEVLDAFNETHTLYKFSYFGQIQSFRNGDKIKEIFRKLGFSLDVFSAEKKQSDDVYTYHEGVSDKDLHKIVASSEFLVAFDNGEPYSHYLPSKAYLYVSFTKPIIVFGNNKQSALRSFLKDYPIWHYHDFNESSVEELKSFISKTHPKEFDEKTYSQFIDYLPQNALKDIVSLVQQLT